jgi:hypothetical protein
MVATIRGGIPVVRRVAADTTGRKVRLPFYLLFLKVRNKGANVARLYFTEADFTANENYVELPVSAATEPYGEWEGPVETHEGDRANIYVRGISGSTDLEIVLFQRRG